MAVNEPVWFSGRAGESKFYSRENAPGGDFGHGDLLLGADSPSSSIDDHGIAWVSGQGGTRGGQSILEFSVENHPNNAGGSGSSDFLVGGNSPIIGGIPWGPGDSGTRGGKSILEFAIEDRPNNAGNGPAFVRPEIDDEVLSLSHRAGGNDSIWIDIGAPVMGAFDGGRGYLVTRVEHTATDQSQSSSPGGYGNPSSFQITSAGADEASSRLFVGNLTMHSEASAELEVLMAGAEGAAPAFRPGGWIADVSYERFAGESDYSGAHVLYQDVFIP